MNTFFIFCFAGSLFFWTVPDLALSAESGTKDSFSVGLQAEYLLGNTMYHISEYSGSSGIESELEFPLSTILAGVNLGYHSENHAKRSFFRVDLSAKRNVDSGSGKVKDSDWLTNDMDIVEVGSAHPGKDIYSESDSELKAEIIDVRAIIGSEVGENAKVGLLLGFRHEKFNYDVSNVNQVGYGPYASSFTGYVSGPVGTYEVIYDLFYAGLDANFKAGKDFTANARIAYAPSAQAKDRDDHILRSKVSTCTASGTAYLASLGGLWGFSENWSMGINGEYLSISTEGTQHQYFYDGSGVTYDIPDKITSSQVAISAALIRKF